MNTRRIPFQFSTTDPLARQKELEKRFGLQSDCPKMYVDMNNPLLTGTVSKETSSPRLQHRIPIFAEGYDHPIHSSVDSMASVPDNKKPNVRVIPIEIEGADRSQRHRTCSGPANTLKDRCDNLASERNDAPHFKRFNFEDVSKPKVNIGPRVYNIPIQVEGDNIHKRPKTDSAVKPQSTTLDTNGCRSSKSSSSIKVQTSENDKVNSVPDDKKVHQSNLVEVTLKKIDDILKEFTTYESEVLAFNGTSKDKQYRYLDEMLTRCMLRLDDIETMGNEEIRLARKSAVKKIQASVDLLESKASAESSTSTEVSQMEISSEETSVKNNEIQENSTENEANSEVKEISMDANEDLSEAPDSTTTTFEKEKSTETIKSLQDKTCDIEIDQEKIASEENALHGIQKQDIHLEDKIGLSETADKVEDNNIMQNEENLTSSLQKNTVSEIEMSEEVSEDAMNSTNTLASEDSKNIKQDQVLDSTVADDVEMVDENDVALNLAKIKESLPSHEIIDKKNDINESGETSKIEMQGVSLEEPGKKTECKTNEQVVDSDIPIAPKVSQRDEEMETVDSIALSKNSDTSNLSQSVNSASSQSEH